jgi:hypothetical protein
LWLTFGIFVHPVLGRALSQNSGSQSTCGCTKVSVNQCPEYEKLSSRVDEMLKKLAETTSLQLEIFRSKKPGEFMRVDKELELMLGEKERRIGALQQHVNEHQCQERAAA